MRPILCRRIFKSLATLGALGLVLVALGARQLGIGHDAAWGPYRKALLLAGLGALLLAQSGLVLRGARRAGRRLDRWLSLSAGLFRAAAPVSARWRRSPRGQALRRWTAKIKANPPDRGPIPPLGPRQDRLSLAWKAAVLLVVLGVELIYVWFVSVGFWNKWPSTSAYYNLQAEAFLHGQTSLRLDPPPQLAKLKNPYDLQARKNISVLWDASYYGGKYYLYWGPAPAALVALLRAAGASAIGDQFIVFASASLLWLFTALIVLYLWRRFAAGLPGWMVLPALALAGLAHPLPWVLNRPAINEAAITAGQAFLFGGLYFALPAIDSGRQQPRRLFLAGVLWALALCSRLSLGGAVAFFSGVVIIRLAWVQGKWALGKSTILGIAGLLLPLVLGGALLGLYNYERFGSPLETGWSYHLSGRGDYSQGLAKAFNPAYILPNTFNYLLVPPRALPVFPFIKPAWGRAGLAPLPLELPEWYYAEQGTGILFSLPFALFTGTLAWWLVCCEAAGPKTEASASAVPSQDTPLRDFRRLCGILLGGVLSLALPVAFYFTASTRFLMDVAPLLILTAVLGSWVAYSNARSQPLPRALLLVLIFGLAAASLLAGLLLGVTGFEARFEHLNPDLFERITRLLAW